MRGNGVVTLLEYLYDQLDMLATIDLADDAKVDAACRVNKAVNDTSRSIVGIADLSMRAMTASPTLGRRNLLSEFFDDKGER